MRISAFSRRYLRRRATDLMTSACRVYRPTPGRVEYDPVQQTATVVNDSTIYTGVCRLWQISGGSHTLIGAEEFTSASMLFSLPWDVDEIPQAEDVIEITQDDDASAIGKWLEILSVYRGGGLRGSRVFNVRYLEKII